jgi:hypothetical protein
VLSLGASQAANYTCSCRESLNPRVFLQSALCGKHCCLDTCRQLLYEHLPVTHYRYGSAVIACNFTLSSPVCGFTFWKDFAMSGSRIVGGSI